MASVRGTLGSKISRCVAMDNLQSQMTTVVSNQISNCVRIIMYWQRLDFLTAFVVVCDCLFVNKPCKPPKGGPRLSGLFWQEFGLSTCPACGHTEIRLPCCPTLHPQAATLNRCCSERPASEKININKKVKGRKSTQMKEDVNTVGGGRRVKVTDVELRRKSIHFH